MSFFSRLSYSLGNEDWQTERRALPFNEKDTVLCVTASGDRPLNLLSQPCKELVSIDANAIQNALLDLKRAAMHKLSFDEYAAFMGLFPHPNRLETLKGLEGDMDAVSCGYWQKHHKMIRRGVLWEGAVEKLLIYLSKVMRTWRRKKSAALMTFDCVEKQRHFLEHQWNTPGWSKLINCLMAPMTSRYLIKDPGLYEHVKPDLHVGRYIYACIDTGMHNFPAKESPLASLFFTGKLSPEATPCYLQEEGVKQIKPHLDRINFETIDLLSYLKKAPDNSFDAFSLSDVVSYVDRETFQSIVREVYRVGKPNARFCIRQFMTWHSLPDDLVPHFKRDETLEKELEQEDRCFFYHFLVGNLSKS